MLVARVFSVAVLSHACTNTVYIDTVKKLQRHLLFEYGLILYIGLKTGFYIYTHTHTHTHTYIYRERERDRDRDRDTQRV